MKIDYSFVVFMIGGNLMITGWLLYHFFNVVFDESIKFIILGIFVLFMSFFIEYKQQNIRSVSHER